MKLVLCIALLASPFVVEGMTLRHGSNQGMTLPRSMTYEEWKHFCHHGNDFCGRGFSLDHLLATLGGHFGGHSQPVVSHGPSGHHMVQHSQPVVHSGFSPSYRAAVRNMPVELFSSDVGALDFSGPALDSGAVDGRYWFFSQAAPVLTTNNKVDFLSKKTAGKDRKKKTEKTEKRMRTVKYPMMRKSKMMRSEGNIVAPVGGHAMAGQVDQSFGQVGQIDHAQVVPEGRWGYSALAQRVPEGRWGYGKGI